MNGGYERALVACYFNRYRQIFIQVLSYGLAYANDHNASHIKKNCLIFTLMVTYSVRGGAIDGLYFYPKAVQDRAIEIGLTTRESIGNIRMFGGLMLMMKKVKER